MRALLADPWFAALPRPARERLLHAGPVRRLAPGESLFRQGDAPGDWHAVVDGTLKASTVRRDGLEAILALLEPGSWFGEISLLDGAPRTHDATALGAAEVLCVPPATFHALMGDPAFAVAIARLLATRIRTLYGVVEDATLRTTRARIARRIGLLARGDVTQLDAPRPAVKVSQEALAMMLGITRQTLSRELAALAGQGVIRLGYRRIEILSPPRLAALGEDGMAAGRADPGGSAPPDASPPG